MIKAVIFDMDNLMIESEILHFKAYKKVLSKFNIVFTEKYYTSFFLGLSDKDIVSTLIDKFNVKISQEDLLTKKNRFFRNKFINKVVPKKGLFDLLNKLYKDKYLLAVASGSQIEEIKIILKNFKINHYFKAIISAEFVKNGKPAPDIFLLTAEKLNVNPEECLVLEDSLNGVIAAKNAGMKCYAIPNKEVEYKNFRKADKILSSLEDIYYLIKKL